MARSIQIPVKATPLWDAEGRCYVLVEYPGHREIFREPSGDQPWEELQDPADWWKNGGAPDG